MRELALFAEHMERERQRHAKQLQRIAADSVSPEDYSAIVFEARAVSVLDRLIADIKELDRDVGAFTVKFLQK